MYFYLSMESLAFYLRIRYITLTLNYLHLRLQSHETAIEFPYFYMSMNHCIPFLTLHVAADFYNLSSVFGVPLKAVTAPRSAFSVYLPVSPFLKFGS